MSKNYNILIYGSEKGKIFLAGSIFFIGFIMNKKLKDFVKFLNIESYSDDEKLILVKFIFYLVEINCWEINHMILKDDLDVQIIKKCKYHIEKEIYKKEGLIDFSYYNDIQIDNAFEQNNIIAEELKIFRLLSLYYKEKELNNNETNFNFKNHWGEYNEEHSNELRIFLPEEKHRDNIFTKDSKNKSVYINKDGKNLFVKNINKNKKFLNFNEGKNKFSFKDKNFAFHLDRKCLSFLAENGTGKTLLTKNIQNYFARADRNIMKKLDNDRVEVINSHHLFHINYRVNLTKKNLYLFSLNNILSNKYDYIVLPNLDYFLKKFTINKIFDSYVKNKNIDLSFFNNYYFDKNNKENKIYVIQEKEEILFSLGSYFLFFFERINTNNNIISLLIFITYEIALENNLEIKDMMEKITSVDISFLKKYNYKIHSTSSLFDMSMLKDVLLTLLTVKDNSNKSIGDYLLASINDFKLSNGFNVIKVDFKNYEEYMNKIIRDNEIVLNNECLHIKKHYSSIFETTLFFPEQIDFLNKKIDYSSFIDKYDKLDINHVGSIFSIIEKNGSEFEKNEYKIVIIELFFNFLISTLNKEDSNKIIIISDDIFTQTDNHNILINLLNFNNIIESVEDQNLITWINFTHSFSFFQTFNKAMNVDRKDLYLMKRNDDYIKFENFPIKNILLLDYLKKEFKGLSNKEQFINLYTRIIYRRFICEHNDDSSFKGEKNLLTKLLHHFPSVIELESEEKNNISVIELKRIILSITGDNQLSYDNLLKVMEDVLIHDFSEYKILDMEITFVLSIYIRFIIEKYIYDYVKDEFNIKTNKDYTGELLGILKNKNINAYNQVKNVYNITKNYIHHDYINYEYIIFVNPNDLKKEAMDLKKILLKLKGYSLPME